MNPHAYSPRHICSPIQARTCDSHNFLAPPLPQKKNNNERLLIDLYMFPARWRTHAPDYIEHYMKIILLVLAQSHKTCIYQGARLPTTFCEKYVQLRILS
jgi:hypothetical protein